MTHASPLERTLLYPALRMPRALGRLASAGGRRSGAGGCFLADAAFFAPAAGFFSVCSAAMLLRSASMRLTTLDGLGVSSFGAGRWPALALMRSSSAFW